MADIRLDIFPFRIDSPSQVIDPTTSFTLSGVTSRGGSGRLGRGYVKVVVITSQTVPPITVVTGNSGFVG